jgi:hypothetical protein
MKNAIVNALVFLLIAAAYVPVWLNIWTYDGEQHPAVWGLFAFVNVAIVSCALFAFVYLRRAVRSLWRKSA